MWGDKDTYRLAFALAGKADNFQLVWFSSLIRLLHWFPAFIIAFLLLPVTFADALACGCACAYICLCVAPAGKVVV